MSFTSPLGANPLSKDAYSYNWPTLTTTDKTKTPFDEFKSPPQVSFTDAFADSAVTHYHLSQENAKKELAIKTIITGQIIQDASTKFYTQVLFPLVPTTGSRVTYSMIEFLHTTAPVTPVEGVPRITQTSMTTGSKALTRRAHGLFAELEYYRTAEGRDMYKMNMRHLATIVAETMCRDAIMALIEGDESDVHFGPRLDSITNIKDVQSALQQEVDRWAIIQKKNRGFFKLDTNVCMLADQYGLANAMDTWIFPKEIDVFLRTTPSEHTSFQSGGEGAVQQVVSSIGRVFDDNVRPALIYGSGKYNIYYSRTFYSHERGPENPMVRERHIGEFFPMVPFNDEDGNNYKTVHRDITIYDENRDCYNTITMQDALNADIIFDDDGHLLHPTQLHKASVAERELDLANCFMYKPGDARGDTVDYVPIHCIGEIKEQFLKTDDVVEMAKSLLSQIKYDKCSDECDMVSAIEKGLALITEYQNKSVEGWLRVIPAFDRVGDTKMAMRVREIYPDGREVPSTVKYVTEFDEQSGATMASFMESTDNEDMFASVSPQELYPYMTNWAGLKYLSSRKFTDKFPIKTETHKTITQFVSAVEKLVLFMSQNLGSNPLLDRKYTVPYSLITSNAQVLLSTLPQFADAYPVEFLMGEDIITPEERIRFPKTGRKGQTNYEAIKTLLQSVALPEKMKIPFINTAITLTKIIEIFQPNFSIVTILITAFMILRNLFKRVDLEAYALSKRPDANDIARNAKKDMLGDFSFAVLKNNDAVTEKALQIQTMLADILEMLLEDLLETKNVKSYVPMLKQFRTFGLNNIQNIETTHKFIQQTINDWENNRDAMVQFPEILSEIASFGQLLPNQKQKWKKCLEETTMVYEALQKKKQKVVEVINGKKTFDISGPMSKNITKLEKTFVRSGYKYVRSSFTLTRKQIAEYVQLVNDPTVGDYFKREDGHDVLWMTVSLPSSGYNTPATLTDLEHFTSDYQTRDLKKQLPHELFEKMKKLHDIPHLQGAEESVTEMIASGLEKLRKDDEDNYIFDEKFYLEMQELKTSDSVTLFIPIISSLIGLNSEKPHLTASQKEILTAFLQLSVQFTKKQESVTEVQVSDEYEDDHDVPMVLKANNVANVLGRIIAGNQENLIEDPLEEANANYQDALEDVQSKYKNSSTSFNSKMKIQGKNSGGYKRAREAAQDREDFSKHRKKAKTDSTKYEYRDVTMGISSPETLHRLTNSVNIIFYSHSEQNCYIDNPFFAKHWNDVHKDLHLSGAEKIVTFALLTTPFHKKILHNFIKSNIILPFNYLIFRPHQRYLTALGVKCKAGKEMGATFYNPEQQNLMEEDRTTTKTRLTHYTWYSRAIVINPKLVHRAWDIFIMACRGGSGTEWYTPQHKNEATYVPMQNYYPENASIFAVMIAYRERKNQIRDVIDASGRFSYWNIAGHRDLSLQNKPHYSTATIYNGYWGWRQAEQSVEYNLEYHPLSIAHNHLDCNTAMWQGPYQCYDSRSKLRKAVIGKGHFESYAYPGCKALRSGGSTEWEMPEMFVKGYLY